MFSSLSETVMKQKRPISFVGMNVNQVKTELTAQLNDKEKMLGKIGTSQISRNALIKQTDTIRKELLDLNRYPQEEELPPQIRSKLEDLANEFQYLKGAKSSNLEDKSSSGVTPLLPPPPTNFSPTKQRTKTTNGNRRNPDIEFATEIGQGLLIEVRKLQTTLQEKEEIIKQLELSQADNERTHETAQRHLKQREEVEERLKEENWNLEVANQELRTHLLESNQSVAKHNTEYGRLAKQLKSQTEQIEIMKAQEEKSVSVIEAMKARHEQETHQLRRHAATAQRENAQTQKQVEALNTELKICKAKLAIKLATSMRVEENASNNATVEPPIDQGSDSEQPNHTAPVAIASTNQSTRSQALETETLKQSLAHAHRIISNLRSSYHKEKLEKFEIKKMLSDSQENIEQMRKEMASWNTNNSVSLGNGRSKTNNKKKTTTKKRRGGVARQPRGLCPNESENEQLSNEEDHQQEEFYSVAEDEEDDDEDDDDDENTLYHGTTLDEIFNNNSTSFAPTTMKSLSSELEAKVQVIDIGINTDPVDFKPCTHDDVQQQDLTVKQQDSDTRSDPFVLLKDEHVPQINDQEVESHSLDENEFNENKIATTHLTRGMDENKQTKNDISRSVSSTTTNVFIQEQIAKALVKERHEIVERAQSILSPKQIQIILPSITQSTDELAIATNNIPTEIPSQQQHHAFNTERSILSSHTCQHINNTDQAMVPKSEVDRLIQASLTEKIMDMVPKSEVDKLTQVAIAEKTMDMVPKSEVDNLIQASIAEKIVDMVPKSEVENLTQVAVTEKTMAMVPKSEVDSLIQTSIAEKIVDMVPKSEVENLTQVAITDKIVDMVPRSEVDNLIQASIAEKIVDMVPKSEVESMTQAAVTEKTMAMLPKSEVDNLIQASITEKTRDMVPKSEVDNLIQASIAEKIVDMVPKSEVENLTQVAITERIVDMVPRSEVDNLIQTSITEKTRDMVPKSEVDNLIQASIAEKIVDMVPTSEVENLTQAAVTEKTMAMLPKSEVDNLIQASITEKIVDMIPKSEVDHLIQASVAEKIVDMVPKSEVENLIEVSYAETRATVERELSEIMVPKAQVDSMIQEAIEKMQAEYKALETEQLALRDGMVTKTDAESMALAAVAVATEKLKLEASTNIIQETQTATDLISKDDADALVQQAIHVEKENIQHQVDSALSDALEKQKADLEFSKQNELEKLETIKLAELEKQKIEMLGIKQIELEKCKQEMEAIKLVELAEQKCQIEAEKQTELEKQKLEIHAFMRTELEKQRTEIEATTLSHLEKQKVEADKIKQVEIETLSKKIDLFKKEAEDTNQRMKNMLTKDSADVLVKRAVAEALEEAEKNQTEALAGMISREYANNMVKDEVAKALEAERKEAAQREEMEAMSMISKAEAEALAKVAAADAIVKERQAMAAREKKLMTKEEADALAESAAREALDKERNETASILARERKALREKEERMITKEEAERNTLEAVRVALLDRSSTVSPPKMELATTTLSNMAASSSSSPSSADTLTETSNRGITSTTHVPTKLSQHQTQKRVSSKNELTPPSAIERSVSTSRLTLPSVNVSPAPSVSTPAITSRKLRLSSSVSSLRLGSGRKENGIQKSQRPSTDSTTGNNPMSFGTFRILENTKYNGGSSRLHSKSSLSLRELSNKHSSSISVSTMSSNEDHHLPSGGRMPMPMGSDESFPGFSNNSSTDMYVISAITQTMIGEWMSKHTRRYVGGGISENKHQRFFWVHPYTKILYWSSVQPGAEGNEAKTKSAFIESVSAVPSHDNSGASPMSLLIRTPKRDLKITAPNLERHDLWLKSLSYLLGRPNNGSNSQLVEESRSTIDSSVENVTQQQLQQSTASISSSRTSERSINHLADTAQYDSDDSDDLVNIRQCCDGKHDVSTLTRGQHHNH